MSALIVGADRIEPIRQELQRIGIAHAEHWSGRRVGDTRRHVPADTRLIVVICDRLNHQLLHNVKRQASKLGVPMVYAHHSLVEVRDKLLALKLAPALAA